jgi:predicted O-methyltransferase YrrM
VELRDSRTQGVRPSFEQALGVARDVEGWLTAAQARRLWERASEVPPDGRVVEIGSFRGRSTIILALAVPDGAEVVAIDPHAGTDRGPQQWVTSEDLGERDRRAFAGNLERAGVSDRVRYVRRRSQEALDEVQGPIDVLYVDGAHRYRRVRGDLAGWGGLVRSGGSLLIHDAFSSIGVTLALLRLMVFGSGWSWRGREGSLAEYRCEVVRGAARLRGSLRQLGQLPWFARNLLIKLALVARMRQVARLLGHRSGPWPY